MQSSNQDQTISKSEKTTSVSTLDHSGSSKNDNFLDPDRLAVILQHGWDNQHQGQAPDWREFDAIEIHPLVDLSDDSEETFLSITDDENDPDIVAWGVYGHLMQQGGIGVIHDCNTLEDAELLGEYCKQQLQAIGQLNYDW